MGAGLILRLIRWLATVLATLLIGTFLEENVRHLIEERHWNEFLASGIKAMPISFPNWFWFLAGFFTGLAAALWLTQLFSRAGNPHSSETREEADDDDFAHGLALDGIQPSLDIANANNTLQIRLLLRNAAPKAVQYQVKNYEYIMSSVIVRTANIGGTIPKDGKITIFSNGGFNKTQYAAFANRSVGSLEYTIEYGPPNRPPLRVAYKLLRLELFKKKGSVVVNWIIENENDEPI